MRDHFAPRVSWEERRWLWNERWLHAVFTSRPGIKLLIAILCGLPLLAVILTCLPLLAMLPLMRSLPDPEGPFIVGVHDFECELPSGAVRIRMWYPADPNSQSRRAKWLPEPATKYAIGYWMTTGLPRWLARWAAMPATWKLAPAALRNDAKPCPPPGASDGWPVTVFSHGLLGCAAAYSVLCAEVASYGSVVLAIEHADGSAVYTERSSKPIPFQATRPATQADDASWRVIQVQQRASEIVELISEMSSSDVPISADAGVLNHGYLDFARLTLMGHSFGGASVLQAVAGLALQAKDYSPPPASAIASASTELRSALPTVPRVAALVLLDAWLEGCRCACLLLACPPA